VNLPVGEQARTRRADRAQRLSAQRLSGAVAFGLSGRQVPLVAVTGFLVRGGIVVLALPAVVLPSVIGLAQITGVRAISIAGQPTPWLIEVALLAVLGVAAWLVAAGVVGALVDVWLVEMALDTTGSTRGRLAVPGRPLILRLVAIRAACAVPLAVALAWAAERFFQATYNELVTPTDLAQPLPLRVALAAADAVAVVTVVWLATETIAAIAVRRQILAGGGIWRSLAGAALQVVRRPLSTLLTTVLSYGAGVAATVAALFATATAFDWCRIAARNASPIAVRLGVGDLGTALDLRPAILVFATIALALAWAVALGLSAVTSAWRSAAFSHEVADALAARYPAIPAADDRDGLGLSGATEERTGD
jgi:hypothetical protein